MLTPAEDAAPEAFGTPPSLCWPDDRSWVLARHVDSDCVHLACSAALADDVLAIPDLAATRVQPNDRYRLDDG